MMRISLYIFAGAVALLTLIAAPGLFSQPASPASPAIGLYEQGKTAQGDENYFQAVEKYKAALALNPHYLDPIKGLAECFFFLDEYPESLRWVEAGKRYDRNDVSLLTLEGRIRIVTGDLDRAKELFLSVLSRQPNNVEAMTGIALLDIAAGRTRFAAKQLEDALVMNPQHRVTLLSLALIYESLGDTASENKYLELALANHPNYFLVHYLAGRGYFLQGDWPESEARLKTALALKGDFQPARLLLGNLEVVLNRPDQAVTILRPLLSQNPENALARFILGVAYWKKSDLANAIASFEGAIALSPDDEFSRLALEQLAIDDLPQGDRKRVALAHTRYEQGRLYEGKNMLDHALLEYRRAIKIDPASKEARLAFANIFRRRGFPMKYLNELQILKGLGLADRRINDDIAYYKTKSIGRVSQKWGIDQHDLDERSLSIRVFSLSPHNSLIHPASAGIVARFFHDIIDGYGKLRVRDGQPSVGSFEEAFREARAAKDDFFVLLTFDEGDRTFDARCRLYLAKTGTLMADLSAGRTGNDRVRDALLKVGSTLNDLLPIRGALIKKQFDRGVVDLGGFQGIKEKDKLVIVKTGRVTLESGTLGYRYSDNDVVGTLTVDGLDEAVSEGTLEKKSFYDYISTGDDVLFLPQGEAIAASAEPAAAPATELLRELLNLK
ncbi:MAG: tetratricopeptide repeat protein [Spirochaetales bacterium]|nr:tetratricopeptide repeat protein [Spirochaetales bacterium]